MTATAIDQQLQRLREAAQRISDNLIELETDPVRIALQNAELTGESAGRWQIADARLAQLWESYGALERVLDRATALRGTRARPSDALQLEVGTLLQSRTIELETQAVPLEDRALLGTAVRTTRCTPTELLERMSASFDEVKAVVAAAGAAWDAGRARIAAARVSVAAGDAQLRLTAFDARLASDPLGTDLAELDAIEAAAEGAARAAALRNGLPDRVAEVRRLLDAADHAEEQARLAHAELTAKVLAPGVPVPDFGPADDNGQLDEAFTLAEHEAWAEAARVLDACAAGAQARLGRAQEAVAASRAPIEQRNRMRGLLDAYRGKARALGRIEDRELGGLYDAASDALHTAPTDLERAGALVRRYQEALR